MTDVPNGVAEIELQVFFDEDYHFLSKANVNQRISEYLKQLEKEFYMLFNEQTTISGLQNIMHTDIPLYYTIKECFNEHDSIYPLRNIVSTSPGKLLVQVLKLPAFDAETQTLSTSGNPKRCIPYCTPLAKNDVPNEICPTCGEVKAYLPNQGSYCTRFCYSSDSRKMKSSGSDFCSICLGRLRSGKYTQKCMHQCCVCHRPWLVLNRAGVCRTCHALIRQEHYNDKQGFKQEHLWVIGERAIDVQNDPQIQESKRVGQMLLSRYAEKERIIDKLQYNVKGSGEQ